VLGSLGLVWTVLSAGSTTQSAGCPNGLSRETRGIGPLDAADMRSNAVALAGQSQFRLFRTAGVELQEAHMLRGTRC
jgi:hypothetical protein